MYHSARIIIIRFRTYTSLFTAILTKINECISWIGSNLVFLTITNVVPKPLAIVFIVIVLAVAYKDNK